MDPSAPVLPLRPCLASKAASAPCSAPRLEGSCACRAGVDASAPTPEALLTSPAALAAAELQNALSGAWRASGQPSLGCSKLPDDSEGCAMLRFASAEASDRLSPAIAAAAFPAAGACSACTSGPDLLLAAEEPCAAAWGPAAALASLTQPARSHEAPECHDTYLPQGSLVMSLCSEQPST